MKTLHLSTIDSTNTFVKSHAAQLGDRILVYADEQTAGRGQRGNSWESEPRRNLTFTVLWRHDGYPAISQFAISEAVALAICDALGDVGIEARVKWPNDIYVADDKICGILIEHAVAGNGLMHSIIGAGVNVNQTEFRSDAPNPVSMAQLAGREFDLGAVMASINAKMERRLKALSDTRRGSTTHGEAQQSAIAAVHEEFKARLWRGVGMHPYRDAKSGECFEARIADIESTGTLVLDLADGETRRYAFKEVEALLKEKRGSETGPQ